MQHLKVSVIGIITIYCLLNVACARRTTERVPTENEEKPKVLITREDPPKESLDLLKTKCDVTLVDAKTKNDILSKCKGMNALFWSTNIKLDAEILDATGSQLIVVGVPSEKYDQIDTAELKKRGIKLSNTLYVEGDEKYTLTSQNLLRGLGNAEMFTPVIL